MPALMGQHQLLNKGNVMTKQAQKTVEEMVKNATTAEVPAAVREMVEDGIKKSKEANLKFTAFAKNMGETCEALATKSINDTRCIADRLLDNATVNAKAALDHGAQVAKANDVQAAANLSVEFAKAQALIWADQQLEIFEMTKSISKDMAEANAAAAEKFTKQMESVL